MQGLRVIIARPGCGGVPGSFRPTRPAGDRSVAYEPHVVGGGLEALLSIAQMPPGVPVACVGVDAARNAAVLAARVLGAQ